ncbi:methylated-DNA--[protein]-cysteine S-methyltransferase [Thermosediminibacter oceani]|uniref:Methylated-DNA--protein-cysteine methyltransferase n=1 Tax=Thermosediminibacter oceani (strain ATCC BAA-1034 / DSM 16646 / JW/IW-1228P) TaxID=555079 RepID=D9S080_THEOJ|nr:methylated-DNA--[protein]-cysteine S-methyltransferase [Thermosediminibacter oceani]ADL07008.1 methylated-DNA/protein-cysteinemethyltransferase [Thermosediminibacter oceani DSM 16646]
MVYFRKINTAIGVIMVASTERGVCRIALPGENMESFINDLKKMYGGAELVDESVRGKSSEINFLAEQELTAYFNRELKNFTVPLDLKGTEFQKKVWKEVMKIPYGEVRSYGYIARAIGKPKACRAVGGANNRNPVPIIVPCHRVVGNDGSLVGYGGGLEMKSFLLKLEGIKREF